MNRKLTNTNLYQLFSNSHAKVTWGVWNVFSLYSVLNSILYIQLIQGTHVTYCNLYNNTLITQFEWQDDSVSFTTRKLYLCSFWHTCLFLFLHVSMTVNTWTLSKILFHWLLGTWTPYKENLGKEKKIQSWVSLQRFSRNNV